MAKVKSKTQKPSGNQKQLFIRLSAFAIFVSVVYSICLRWIGDDIFIGFRYIQNFIAGDGLVYNIGERVEGYTDFLWLMLISIFAWLKMDPVIVAQTLGILFSAGTLIIFSAISYRIASPAAGFIIPFIPIALALNYDYNVWATGGLEVSFYTFLLSTAFYIYFFSDGKESKRNILTGLFLILAVLTRPDAAIIFIIANILLLIYQFKERKKLSEISWGRFFSMSHLLYYIFHIFYGDMIIMDSYSPILTM